MNEMSPYHNYYYNLAVKYREHFDKEEFDHFLYLLELRDQQYGCLNHIKQDALNKYTSKIQVFEHPEFKINFKDEL